jgi:hypothetical protein
VSYSTKAASTNSNSTGALSVMMAVSTGWVLGLAATHLNNSGIDTAPTSMTNRATLSGATNGRIALADTNSAVSSYAGANVTIASSADWWTNVVEIIDTGTVKASGGASFRPVNIRGGADQ